MCFDYDDYCEVWREKKLKARKLHRCHECGGEIAVGDRYRFVFSIFKGVMDQFQECEKCEAIRNTITTIEISRGCYGVEAIPPLRGLAEAVSESSYGFLIDGSTIEDCDGPWDGERFVRREAAHLFPDLCGAI